MNFREIAEGRQSCRAYDSERDVEQEKLDSILEVARLSPSACNGQPYHVTVCRGEAAKKVFAAKGRPCDNPLIVHIADKADIEKIAFSTELSKKLADAFMPGWTCLNRNRRSRTIRHGNWKTC